MLRRTWYGNADMMITTTTTAKKKLVLCWETPNTNIMKNWDKKNNNHNVGKWMQINYWKHVEIGIGWKIKSAFRLSACKFLK